MDQKDSVNAVLFFADSFTWPEALRSFMQAEAELYAEPLELMTSLAPEYPMAPSEKIVESRVKILSFLVDQVRTVILIGYDGCRGLQMTVRASDLFHLGHSQTLYKKGVFVLHILIFYATLVKCNYPGNYIAF